MLRKPQPQQRTRDYRPRLDRLPARAARARPRRLSVIASGGALGIAFNFDPSQASSSVSNLNTATAPGYNMANYEMDSSPAPDDKVDDAKKISFRFCREW